MAMTQAGSFRGLNSYGILPAVTLDNRTVLLQISKRKNGEKWGRW